jgi:WD40 repeat protein
MKPALGLSLALTFSLAVPVVAESRDRLAGLAATAAAGEALELLRGPDAQAWLERVPAGERGWTWRLLGRRADQSTEQLLEKPGPLADLGLAGSRLAVATPAGELWLDDLSDPTPARSVMAHDEGLVALALDATGGRVVTTGRDEKVKVWDFATGALLAEWQTEAAGLGDPSFSPDGTKIAVGGFTRDPETRFPRGWLEVFSPTGERLASIVPTTFFVGVTAFSPDGAWLAAGGPSGEIDLLPQGTSSAATPQRIAIEDSDGFPSVDSLAFSPKGDRLGVGGGDGAVRVFETTGWARVATHRGGHRSTVSALAFTSDGRLVTGGLDRTIQVWREPAFSAAAVLLGHRGGLVGLALAPDGSVLSAAEDGSVRRWNLAATPLLPHDESVYGLDLHPSGLAATADAAGTVRVWDLATRTVRREIAAAHDGDAISVAFAKDGKSLLSGGNDGRLRLWDLETGAALALFEDVEDGRQNALSLSGDGRFAAAGSSRGTVKLWNLADRSLVATLAGHKGEVEHAIFTPDGTQLVTGDGGGEVFVWSVPAGALVRRFKAHDSEVHGLALSPDGKRLATASNDRRVRIWDLATGEPRVEMVGHSERVWDVAWSPDGTTLATAANDSTLRVWDAETGLALAVVSYPIQLYRVAFTPDGRFLVVVPFGSKIELLDGGP